MSTFSEKVRSKKTLGFTIGTIVLLPLLIFSCHHYYSQSVTRSLVEQFSISTKLLFEEKLENEQAFNETRYDRLLTELASSSDELPLLTEAYAASDYAFQFVQEHLPTQKHNLLRKRVLGLVDDGVDLEVFQLDDHAKAIEALAKLNLELASNSQVVPTDPEKEILFGLVEQASDQKGKSLTPLEMLELSLKKENESLLPSIHEAWKSIYQMADERARFEATIEADSGRQYFLLMKVLLPFDQFHLENWNLFIQKPAEAIAALEPKVTHYEELKKGLAQYREYAAKPYEGHFFNAGMNTKIKQGSKEGSGDLVVRIKQRLALEGYWSGETTPEWDDALTEALTRYQINHQVVPDGVYGRGTALSFNITMTERVNQIRLALQRLRESKGRFNDYYVRINIPEMGLEVRENQKIIRRHKVIVGNQVVKNNTPTFSDEIELINFNPSWFVPDRIIKEEMQPDYDKDNESLQKQGYKVKVNDEGKVLSVTQPPGPGNALGNVKILFPNPHDVYLHDTPKKYLFDRTVRPFSHGCMRLQYASDLATFLLEKEQNPEVPNIKGYLEKRTPKEIYLKKPIPIHVEYVLASSNENGEVVFFGDVYSKEKDILLAMGEK